MRRSNGCAAVRSARSSWRGPCRSTPDGCWILAGSCIACGRWTPIASRSRSPTGTGSVLVGASPELLVSRHGTEVRANPLAGSAPRAGDPEEDRANAEALGSSAKDRQEHAIVVEAVFAALHPLCTELHHDADPVLLPTANVWHLSTRFRGRLREPAPTALALAAALHPTPAVAGTPTRGRARRHRRARAVRSRLLRRTGRVGRRERRRRMGDRASVRGARGRARDAVRRCRDRGRLGSGRGARRDRAEVPRVPGLAALGLTTDADARDDGRRRRLRDPRLEPRQGAVPRDRRHEDGSRRVLPGRGRGGADRVPRPSDDHASVPQRRGRRAVLSEARPDAAAAVGADGDDHVPERTTRRDDRAGRRRAPGVDGEPRVPRHQPVAGAVRRRRPSRRAARGPGSRRPACRGATCET